MPDEKDFQTNLMRLIAAEVHYSNMIVAAREMFGKSLYQLDSDEQDRLARQMLGDIGFLFGLVKPDTLETKEKQVSDFFRTPPSDKIQ